MSVIEIANKLLDELPEKKFEKAVNYLEIISMACEIIEISSTKCKKSSPEEKRECAALIARKITQKAAKLKIINDDIEEDILYFIDSHVSIYGVIDSLIDMWNSSKSKCCKGKNKFKKRYL